MEIELRNKNKILRDALLEIKRLKLKVKENKSVTLEPIAIVGMACHFPGGITNPQSYWQALLNQEDMISEVPADRWVHFTHEEIDKNPYLKKAGFLTEDVTAFDHQLFRLSPEEAERTDPQQRLFLKVCWEALENAGYAPDELKGSKTGVYAGISTSEHAQQLFAADKNDLKPSSSDAAGSSSSFISGRASYFFGFQGPGITIDTACSSSLVAVDQACKALLLDDCDMAIAGGVNLLLSPETTELMASLNILSPDCQSRTFDASANGTVRGEGCGVIVLKTISQAEKDGDFIHAIIKASGSNHDGLSAGLTAPYGPSQEKLINEVWAKAGISPNEIDFIETHGTGTELGDPIEIEALGNLFSTNKDTPVYLGAVKTAIGHLEAASGIAGLIKAILAVENGQIPGNLHFRSPTPHISWENLPFKIPTETVKWEKLNRTRKAAISSFGLSGTNAHAIIEQYLSDNKKPNFSTQEEYRKWPFRFTAPNSNGLINQLKTFLNYVERQEIPSLRALSYSHNVTRSQLKERLVIWGKDRPSLLANLQSALAGKANADIQFGKPNKKVVFLFTGGGSQYPGMFEEYYRINSTFKEYFDRCNILYQGQNNVDLSSIIFSKEDRIHEMRYTQVALFAVEYALAQTWISYGVTPKYVIGHSMCEYVAACLAGVFTLEDAIKLITARGELMHALPQNGKMMAVRLNEEETKQRLNAYPNLSIAGINSFKQTTIAGDSKEMAQLVDSLKGEGIDNLPVKLTHACHSPMMRPMIEQFEEVSRKISYQSPCIPLLSNVTGKPIQDEIADYTYWSEHILSPVRFYQSIQALGKLEDYIFVEIGPKGVLTQMVDVIADGAADYLVSNIPNQNTHLQMERCVFHLANCGININWKAYYQNCGIEKVVVPNYQFTEKQFALSKSTKKLALGTDYQQLLNGLDSTALSPEERKHFPAIYKAMKNVSHLIETEESNDSFSVLSKALAHSPLDLAEAKAFVEQGLNTTLGLEEGEIKDNENLLLYGIDSILVARLLNNWRNELNLLLKPAAFLGNPTIHNWATQIFETSKKEGPQHKENLPFVANPENRHQPFELTEVQNAYWVGRNPEIQWGGYSCYGYMEVEAGMLHIERFTLALQQLVDRHEMLRCVIGSDGQQKILQEVNFGPGIYQNHEIANSSIHLSQIRSEMRSQTFTFDHLMFDVRLTETSPQNWLIHFGLDFMIADALSINIFWKDLHCLYKGDNLPKLDVSFRDYAFYLTKRKSGSHYQLCKNYWESRIDTFPEAPRVPVINVNKEDEFKGFKRFEKVLDTETWKAFTASAASQNLTPSAALLTLYSEILSAWGSGSHFGLMLTVFERENVHPQINDIMGDFTQLVLLEVHRKHQSIAKNGQKLQWQMQEDLAHTAYSAVDVVKAISRLKSTIQLYPFVFTSALGVEGYQEGNNVPYFGLAKNLVSQTPQVWLDAQVSLKNGQICLSWDCYKEIFAQDILAAMFESYTQLVRKVALDPNQWNETIMDARPADQVALHHKVNETKDEQDKQLLHEAILENAQLRKDKLAVVCFGKSYTYKDLVIRADQFSACLQERGFKTGDHVAVQLSKSLDVIAAVIGLLQAGGVYVPIQYDNPTNRATIILKQSDTRFIISDKEDTFEEVQVEQISTYSTKNKSGIWKKPTIEPDSTAYIIFTSGSTGVPKGVEISHAAAMNTILDVNRRFSVTSEDRVLGISSLSFDLSVYDIFGVLGAGGTLVLPTEAERIDPKCWYRLSKDCGVTLWNSAPAILGLYVDYINRNPETSPDMTIEQVFLSGDWIPMGLYEKMAQALPHARMISMGGATEASIWSNYHEVTEIKPEWASIPYGYPLANQSFYVLDEFGRSCPNWVPGELHIAGDGLARGYYNAKELTDRAFFTHPELQIRLYATGDYGRYTCNGELEFLGRQDDQLKINGYRIEIGEIKAAFLKYDETLDPVILPIGGHMQSKKLIAFVKSSVNFSENHLKSALAHYLPPYFIPEKILAIDQYPQTVNGKMDIKALQELYENEARVKPLTSQATNINHHPVLKTMRLVFELPELKPSDHFASLGVSSMDIIQLSNQLEADFGDRPAVGDMIQYESVNDLLAYYDNRGITFKEESEVATIHPQFLPFSPSQMAYLKQLEVIDRPESDTFYQNGVTYRHSNLEVQKCIPFSDDKLAVKTHTGNKYNIIRFSDQAVSQKDFAHFLSLCFNLHSSAQNFHNDLIKSFYPLQFYLSVFEGKVGGIAQGNYYLDVVKKELLQLRDGSSTLTRTNDPDSLKNCAFVVHLVADLNVVYPIYAERTLPVCYTESGLTSQQLSTEALQFSIGSQQLTDYHFEQEKADFQLTDQHFYLHSIAVGSINSNQENLSGGDEAPEWKNEEATLKGLLEQCESRGIKLWEEEGKLKFKAPEGAMNKEMQGRLKEQKRNLIPFLADKRIQEEAQANDPALQPFELTPIQWAYVSGRGKDFELGNTGAHFYTEIECESIDTQAFESALNKIITKHEALRTIISEDGTQQVMPETPYYRIKEQTITQEEEQIQAIRKEWSHHLYTIGQWPMFHFQISRFPDESLVRLHVSIDLLIIDAWSGDLMLSEIFMEMAGEPVPKPNITFKEYIRREKGWHKKNYRFVKKAQAYWNNQLETLPEAPSLPYRKPLSQIENPKFSRWQFEISKEDMKNFVNTANKVNATVTAVICTAFMKILSSWASQDELTLNLTLFNRLPLHKDAMRILGDFTNLAFITWKSHPNATFQEEVNDIQKQLWLAIEHRAQNGLNLSREIGKDQPRKASMPVVFTSLLSGKSAEEEATIFPEGLKEVYAISQTPQVAIDHHAYRRGGNYIINWDLVEEAFDTGQLQQIFGRYEALIRQIITSPDWNKRFKF